MPSLFLSYAAEDAAFAERLGRLVSARGAKVLDDTDIAPGEEWAAYLRQALEEASAVVLLLPSAVARHRNNLWFEVGAARTMGKRVLAVLPPGRRLVEVPGGVADVLILDADQRPLEEIADTLLHAVPDDTKESQSLSQK